MSRTIGPSLLIEMEMDGLDQDASLETLSARYGYSPFHFHRRFAQAVGETPKQHMDRLRLERAAYLVAVTEQRLLDLALDLGFRSHETFTRVFRRAWGCSPSQYRTRAKQAHLERLGRNRAFRGEGCMLSEVWFGALPAVDFIAVRRMGSYYDLLPAPFSSDDRLWAKLAAFAAARNIDHERTAWCIPYDNPLVTADLQQRMDACIPAGPGEPEGDIRHLAFQGGRYAGAEHTGPHETVRQAYTHVADGIRSSKTWMFAGGPPVQVFRHVDKDLARCRTEVYFPIARR